MPDQPARNGSDLESDTQRSLPPTLPEQDFTQRSTPVIDTQQMPRVNNTLPPPPPARPQPMILSGPRKTDPRKPRRDKRDSGLYLPIWSVALMLLVVLGVAAGLVGLMYALGGSVAPGGTPRVVVITAAPSSTPEAGAQPIVTPTVPATQAQNAVQQPPPTIILAGPTVAVNTPEPTRQSIGVGMQVTVINVGDAELNVRSQPGRANQILFTAKQGRTFNITGGPAQADGLTWWQVQDVFDTTQVGWVAENDGGSNTYLEVVP
jgi:hypothetical protein